MSGRIFRVIVELTTCEGVRTREFLFNTKEEQTTFVDMAKNHPNIGVKTVVLAPLAWTVENAIHSCLSDIQILQDAKDGVDVLSIGY